MGKKRLERGESGDGGGTKRTRSGLRSQKVEEFSHLEWEWGKAKRGGKVKEVTISSSGKGEPIGKRVLQNLQARVLKHQEIEKEIEGSTLMLCHECQSNDKDVRVVRCSNCNTNVFCVPCIKQRYRQLSEYEVA